MKHVLLAIAIASAPLAAQTTTMAVPPGAAMDAYPIMSGPLPVRDMARLRVRPVALDSSWTGYNWYRDKKRFVYETLPKGTIVLVDASGTIRYKADCGNRLVAPTECPRCLGALRPDTARMMAEALGGSVASSRNLSVPADSAASGIKKAAFAVWRWVADRIADGLWLLALLAGVLLIPLILWALWRLFQTRGTSGSGRGTPLIAPSPVPVAPTPSAPGPTVSPAPVTPGVPPVSGRRFVNYEASTSTSPAMVRFGGFTTARMEEADGVVTIRIS